MRSSWKLIPLETSTTRLNFTNKLNLTGVIKT